VRMTGALTDHVTSVGGSKRMMVARVRRVAAKTMTISALAAGTMMTSGAPGVAVVGMAIPKDTVRPPDGDGTSGKATGPGAAMMMTTTIDAAPAGEMTMMNGHGGVVAVGPAIPKVTRKPPAVGGRSGRSAGHRDPAGGRTTTRTTTEGGVPALEEAKARGVGSATPAVMLKRPARDGKSVRHPVAAPTTTTTVAAHARVTMKVMADGLVIPAGMPKLHAAVGKTATAEA